MAVPYFEYIMISSSLLTNSVLIFFVLAIIIFLFAKCLNCLLRKKTTNGFNVLNEHLSGTPPSPNASNGSSSTKTNGDLFLRRKTPKEMFPPKWNGTKFGTTTAEKEYLKVRDDGKKYNISPEVKKKLVY